MTEKERLAALAMFIGPERAARVSWPETVGSTNRVLGDLARQGAPAGTAVLAEEQTAGRGRFGRSFVSPPGAGLYLSFLLRPQVPPETAGLLTGFAAVAVRRAIRETCGLETEIKWVNDLYAGGGKLCGILAESSLRGAGVAHIVLGVGINVTATAGDFPPELRGRATSILLETGSPPDRFALAGSLLRRLDALAGDFPGEREAYLAEYRAGCLTLGREVTLPGGERGIAEDIGADYSLLVRLPSGELRRLNSGEATLHGEQFS